MRAQPDEMPAPPPPPPISVAPPATIDAEIREVVTPRAPASDDGAALRRALDDLDAAKRRVERDAGRARDEARAAVVSDMLPVLDNLDRSVSSAQGSSDPALLQGVTLVRDQFEQVLARCGLERIDSVGRRFDPGEHEALAVVDVIDRERDGIVVDEIERGYRLSGRVLRAPKVRVGRFTAPTSISIG